MSNGICSICWIFSRIVTQDDAICGYRLCFYRKSAIVKFKTNLYKGINVLRGVGGSVGIGNPENDPTTC